MFVPAPIDKDFVPYTNRPVTKYNAGLFVDAAVGGGAGAMRVVPQNFCAGKPDGTRCGPFPNMICIDGTCNFQ